MDFLVDLGFDNFLTSLAGLDKRTIKMRKIRIFLSSEMTGLLKTRAQVKSHIEKNFKEIEVEAAGLLPNSFLSLAPAVASLEVLESCDIYIGVFWRRSGFFTSHELYITELEFFYASGHFIPSLIFILSPENSTFGNISTPIDDELISFLDLIKSLDYDNKICYECRSLRELYFQLDSSLSTLISKIQNKSINSIRKKEFLLHPIFSLEPEVWESRLKFELLGTKNNKYNIKFYGEIYECIKNEYRDSVNSYSKIIKNYQGILIFIRNNILQPGFLLNPSSNKVKIIEITAEILKIFSICFNWIGFEGSNNYGSLWCAICASKLYQLCKKWSSYKETLLFVINAYLVKASSHRAVNTNAFSSSYSRKVSHQFLMQASTISSFLIKHSLSPFGDSCYSAIIHRELGNYDVASKSLESYIDFLDKLGKPTTWLFGELLYTKSLDATRGYKSLDRIIQVTENVLHDNIISSAEFLTARKYAETMINLGEIGTAAKWLDKLQDIASENEITDQIIKIDRIKNLRLKENGEEK
jgi:tetratricopeptide (TPR) repeat protein